MKPIFKEEKLFLERKLGIELPEQCWRKGQAILLNGDIKTLILKFKVEKGKLIITKNKMEEVLAKVENKSWQQEIENNNERLNQLREESIYKTKEFMQEYDKEDGEYQLRLSHSGGKDSDVMWNILQQVFKELGINNYIIDFFNTSNDTAQTYLHIKQDLPQDKLEIHNPEKGWYQWLKEDKNYYLQSVMVRNCCSTYKEGSLKKILDKKKDYILFLGARKYESTKRALYDWDLNMKIINDGKMKLNMPFNWRRFLPIVNWTDKDIWLYILRENIKINKQYYLGYNRCGCLECPYASNYTDMITKENYPLLHSRWLDIVEKNYTIWGVKKRLKWSLEEWKGGKWKQATSKEYELITKKPNEERITELAKIKGCSRNIAAKYFNRKCSCGKKLNPDEIAMFLKTFGRYEGQTDDREYLCEKCYCEIMSITKSDYKDRKIEFRNQGCELF